MNYQIGDLLLGKHGGKIFMIKKVIDIKRALFNGVYLEDTVGYRIAPTDNLGYAYPKGSTHSQWRRNEL